LQAALAIGGLVLTSVFGIRFILWAGANWSSLQSNNEDPFEALWKMWLAMRWAVAGIGLFAIGWLWALITSLGLLRDAKDEERAAPPRLQ
jgi:hypothetical protein